MHITNMQERYEQLQQQIELELSSSEVSIENAKAALRLIRNAQEESFESCLGQDQDLPADRLYHDRISGMEFYYKELLWIYCHQPILGDGELAEFYKKQIAFIRHFFSRHATQYQSHKIQLMELEPEDMPSDQQLHWNNLFDEELSSADENDLRIRFFGYEHLLEDLICRLRHTEGRIKQVQLSGRGEELMWTGKLVNLVELAYGLQETAQINNGRASLADILKCLKDCFQVHVQGPYRIYSDIKSRKVMNPLAFLDQMRDAVSKKMEEELGYVPGEYIISKSRGK
ncbi:RteC domain-containing protein [Pedobacter sp. GR22-6]|uniref:RteC domain-containing protein n=1 Tax=Pedobacter sp. GR22-6 TaxID=3127957 RepID=UPI00307E11CC